MAKYKIEIPVIEINILLGIFLDGFLISAPK
jgi:hypothetical protein